MIAMGRVDYINEAATVDLSDYKQANAQRKFCVFLSIGLEFIERMD